MKLGVAVALLSAAAGFMLAADSGAFLRAEENGKQFDRKAAAMHRLMNAWLKHADSRTLLLPDRLPGFRRNTPDVEQRLYTPHNSGADLYPYLILTSHLTDPSLYHGRMMEMLRNEIRYTTVQDSIPGNLALATGELGPPSLFGAGEYAKDGLLAVTELLGRTPWFYRMVDMTADVMRHAPVKTRFGNLPAASAELNGDLLQVLVRLATMTSDPRFLEWARRIGDAYVEEVLPGNHGLPSTTWDFEKGQGESGVRLRDHGNEAVVGLTLLAALEQDLGSARAAKYRDAVRRMLDRILESANPDGMLYNVIDASTLQPVNKGLSDNWGYVYGAVYTFYQMTGEESYRNAVRKVLSNLNNYRNYPWEGESFDGYADSIESALYLVAREPVPAALEWIDSETEVMANMQKKDGLIEYWYGEGNFNRTLLLYILYKSQGCRPDFWIPGVRVGAVRDGDRLLLNLAAPKGWDGRVRFDYARHRRVLNLAKNYVRLNEFPEWYTVDENRLYRLRPESGGERQFLGSELIAGVRLEPGSWIVEPLGNPPYARGQAGR